MVTAVVVTVTVTISSEGLKVGAGVGAELTLTGAKVHAVGSGVGATLGVDVVGASVPASTAFKIPSLFKQSSSMMKEAGGLLSQTRLMML